MIDQTDTPIPSVYRESPGAPQSIPPCLLDLAKHLVDGAVEIMNDWSDVIRRDLPSLDEASLAELRLVVEGVLTSLAASVTGLRVDRNMDPTPPDEVVAALRTFRTVLFARLESRAPVPSEVRELVLLAIDAEIDLIHRAQTNQYLEMAIMDLESLRNEREVREKFISALSHDLRTPLSVGVAGADMLMSGILDAERIAKVATRIKASMQRADRMVRDLLDANQIRIGRPLSLRAAHCNMNDVLNDTAEELSLIAGDRFEVRIRGNLEGYWEAESIKRIVENLVHNALKYGSPSAKIKIMAWRNRDLIKISVHNDGEPIPAAEVDHVFEPFRRSPPGQTTGHKGWGLGLTLVRGLCEAHGGSVRVESDHVRGTNFIVELPVHAYEPRGKDAEVP